MLLRTATAEPLALDTTWGGIFLVQSSSYHKLGKERAFSMRDEWVYRKSP